MSFFTSVEFYIILTIVAAAIIALASRPDSVGPVAEHLLAGEIEEGTTPNPSIALTCLSNGKVMLERRGIEGLCEDGAVSLAIKVKGTDVDIEERLTPGRSLLMPMAEARFMLSFLRPARYHLRYNSSKTGLFVAFSFTVKPGVATQKELVR